MKVSREARAPRGGDVEGWRQPHLFEAFYRGEDELTRKTKGMKTVEKTAHGPDQAADTGT